MKLSIHTPVLFVLLLATTIAYTQNTDKPFSISGNMGFTYEGYGLSTNPAGSGIYSPRRPWNQLRFNLAPRLQFGKNFTLPFNFNFNVKPVNFAGPYAGIKKPSFSQFLTNPANNFAINPRYKWAELQLGTQYLRYSELSTGDVGIFGAGISLNPSTYIFKFFAGSSQKDVNYVAPGAPTGTDGAFHRNHWMLQLGKQKENDYTILLNIARGEDRFSRLLSPPPTSTPQEGAVVSIVLEKYLKKGWYIKTEGAQSAFTKDLYQPSNSNLHTSFKPLIRGRASTQKDHAVTGSIGKKSANFDIGYSTKYVGAGFQTTGYPYLQPDRWDNTVNTRFNTWKNKMNVVASIGQRINNLNSTSLTAKQFIATLNWFTQFNEHFNTNISYNNFGFTAASGTNPYGVKNVSNDFGFTASYNWSNAKRMNMITFNYNLSKYDERDVFTGITSTNNTHTLLLSYIPSYFKSEIAPDFSILYFNNALPAVKNTLITFSSSITAPAFKKRMNLRSQLQYTIGKLNSYTSNKNLVASLNADIKLAKQLTWTIFLSTNYFKYGNELILPSLEGANYFESDYRTGLQYKF